VTSGAVQAPTRLAQVLDEPPTFGAPPVVVPPAPPVAAPPVPPAPPLPGAPVQTPASQRSPTAQAIPQAPQCRGSLAVLVQAPPQSCCPAAQAHNPAWQV